jgi:hypothetical protein
VHQAAIALDIRGEDGHETSLDWRSLHRQSPPDYNVGSAQKL